MTASVAAFSAIQLAGQHLPGAIQEHRARQCYDRADMGFCAGQFDAARVWALRSLEYSVGTQHADYRRTEDGKSS